MFDAIPLETFLQAGDVLCVPATGQVAVDAAPRVLLPGSFNPVHPGHWGLARAAEEILGEPIAFEISVINVDKPPLTRGDLTRRLGQFAGRADVWLTHAPRFLEKAERFPKITFVVGADTALRLVLPRYYEGDPEKMLAALQRLRELECDFLVACRAGVHGQCLLLQDVPIPPRLREMFREIPPARFRLDVSSTELRQRGQAP